MRPKWLAGGPPEPRPPEGTERYGRRPKNVDPEVWRAEQRARRSPGRAVWQERQAELSGEGSEVLVESRHLVTLSTTLPFK